MEVYDKSILCIGNLNQAENMVLLLYSTSVERGLWKRESLERPTTTIGRDQANHICLPGPGVSSCTAESIGVRTAMYWRMHTVPMVFC